MISTVIRWKFELNNEIKGYIYVKDRGKRYKSPRVHNINKAAIICNF